MPDAIHAYSRPLKPVNIVRCRLLSHPDKHGFSWRPFWYGLQQTFRLMVGVQDYQNYLQHMQLQHPHLTPMNEREFHRYCLEARFPSQPGKLGKCPC